MDELKAKVLALEVVIIALARANPNKEEAFSQFAKVFPEMARSLNKTDADHPGLGQKFTDECNRLGIYLK